MEFGNAKFVFNNGVDAYFAYRLEEAARYFNSCLKALDGIAFYQNVASEVLIDRLQFDGLRNSVLLYLGKCLLENEAEWEEYEGYFREYLSWENRISEINALEQYLVENDLLGKDLEADFNALDRLAFQLMLYFKQNRFPDILKVARLLQSSSVIIPPAEREHFMRILMIIGDAYEKTNSFYDAGDFYLMALGYDPANLEILLKLRSNYETLYKQKEIGELDAKIYGILSRQKTTARKTFMNRGGSLVNVMLLDGRDITLEMKFKEQWGSRIPLVSVAFNGEIVWENYLEADNLVIPVESEVGSNSVKITAVNRSLQLLDMTWRWN